MITPRHKRPEILPRAIRPENPSAHRRRIPRQPDLDPPIPLRGKPGNAQHIAGWRKITHPEELSACARFSELPPF